MTKLSALIIDDEKASRDVLERYIRETPLLLHIGSCVDAFQATAVLSEKKIDVIFLDINMPGLSGIDFARSLIHPPPIIFVTAYPEFAVEGFELSAVDYLVKPYSYDRFLKAVNKLVDRISGEMGDAKDETILIRSNKKTYSVAVDSIRYVEGMGDYIVVSLPHGKRLVVHDTMKGFTSMLPESHFLRVHRSYTVNTTAVEYLEGNQLVIEGKSIPVSPAKKQLLLERL